MVLATERRDLMPMDTADWSSIAGITPMSRTIKPMIPEAASAQFMEMFFMLSTQKRAIKKTPITKQLLNYLSPTRLSFLLSR